MVDRGNHFCTDASPKSGTVNPDEGMWGPKAVRQTAQRHQAIFELSADGSIVSFADGVFGNKSVKGGSPYRRRAGDGISNTGTDKPSRSLKPAPAGIGSGNGKIIPSVRMRCSDETICMGAK